MSVYHYLFDAASGRCVALGPVGRREDHRYSGPSVHVDGHDYRLPAPWLDRLMTRFRERHPEAHLVDEGALETALAPAEAARPDEVLLFEVGGDAVHDVPLRDYLPEVDTPEFREALASDPALRIR